MALETFTTDERYGGLLHPEFVSGVIEGTIAESLVLSKFTRLRNMIGREMWFNVRDLMPSASAVDPIDEPITEPPTRGTPPYMKPITHQRFAPRILRAGEFASFKVFREADLSDALNNGYDVIAGDMALFSSQFAAAIDRAVVWGQKKPIEWNDTDSLWKRAQDNDLVIDPGTSPGDSAYSDIFGEDGVMQKIELSGYDPNGLVSALQMRAKLQGMKDPDGRPIFAQNATMQETTPFTLGGFPLWFARNGMWRYDLASMLMADFTRLVYSIRQELTSRITRDGDFTDTVTGEVHHLAQQNKVALVLHMRMGWQILDPVNQMSDTPVPFAFLGAA